MPSLLIVQSDGTRLEPFEIRSFPLIVGRSEDADLRLNDSSVSRMHAVIDRTGAGFSVEDLDSVNGVWLNGDRVMGRTDLENRDRLMIGDFEIIFNA